MNLEGVFCCCYSRPSNHVLKIFSNLDQVFENYLKFSIYKHCTLFGLFMLVNLTMNLIHNIFVRVLTFSTFHLKLLFFHQCNFKFLFFHQGDLKVLLYNARTLNSSIYQFLKHPYYLIFVFKILFYYHLLILKCNLSRCFNIGHLVF